MNGNAWRRTAAALAIAAAAGAAPGRSGAEEGMTRLNPVVVTATRIEQPASEQASSVSVVTRDEIELKVPAVAGDVLKDIPGVVVQRSGSPGSLENIKIRGGLGPHTLVMIDGFPVNSPTLGSFDIGALPVEDFERVEVVRGAQSALYGSNAMGGVVNFITRKGEEGAHLGAGALGGSRDSLKWKGSVQGGGRIGGGHLGANGFESEGFLANDETSLASALGSGEVAVGERSRFRVIAFYSSLDKGIPVDFGTPRDINHELDRRSLLTGARWEVALSRVVQVTLSGMLFRETFHESDPADPGESFPYVFTDDTKTRKADARIEARLTPGSFSTTFLGLEYLRDRATDNLRSNFGNTDLDASTTNRSVFLQEELRFGRRAGLSLGVRLDRNSEAGTEWNPKGAFFYEIGRGIRVRTAVGRGFRVPTISEKGDPFVGNPGLSAEKAVSYEAGTDISLAGDRARISATYFYQDFRGLIQFDPSAGGALGFGQLVNKGHAFSRGVESEVRIVLGATAEADLTYTWSDTWDGSSQRRILGTPGHRGTASLLLTPTPALSGRVDWLVESDQLDVHAVGGGVGARPGFARLDASARYRLKKAAARIPEIVLTGKVQNVLDRSYEERLDIPAPGINFLLGAEARI